MAAAKRQGPGRPSTISQSAVVDEAVGLGLEGLTLAAVATRLGVTKSALYHYISGIDSLEELVADRILADLEIPNEASTDLDLYLLDLARALRKLELANPAIGRYLARAGDGAVVARTKMLAAQWGSHQRGLSAPDAVLVTSAVAAVAFELAANERLVERKPPNTHAISAPPRSIAHSSLWIEAQETLAEVSADQHFDWVVSALIRGLLSGPSPTDGHRHASTPPG